MWNLKKTFGISLAIVFFLVLQLPAWAGAPTDKIKQTTEKIIAILKDPQLQGPAKTQARNKKLREAADERFDWEEMAKRTLGKYWNERTPEEKKTFVPLFITLLERSYLDKVQGYSGEKVHYAGESIDGKYSVIDVKIVTDKGQEIAVSYKMKNKADDWFIYDIVAEGVSLVNNYRVQFNSILAQSPYAVLIRKMEEKIAQPQVSPPPK
ncbi:MAG: ABC transporter substrate-binding protein [Desulfobacteraceae bacterium]|nr:MAG: ABC transporter substrate-binding protein [Desulfobacteraceae bacterium]